MRQQVEAFFHRRQSRSINGEPKLRIESIVKVENVETLSRFQSTGSFDIIPLQAHQQHRDTLLFHGCPDAAAPNIQADGLLLLENAMDEYCGLEQIHDIDWSARDYTYQGEIMSWGRVRDDFIVKVLVSHDLDTDELEGEVDVAPLRRVDYGHDDEFGGAFSFRGERALE